MTRRKTRPGRPTKPDQVREKWVELMNDAMERAGIEQGMDARSWAH